jgi:hypothetical protein
MSLSFSGATDAGTCWIPVMQAAEEWQSPILVIASAAKQSSFVEASWIASSQCSSQ